MILTVGETDSGGLRFIYVGNSDRDIGYIYMEVDGYWVFMPKTGQGHWDSYSLRAIADKLDELNKPWDDKIKREFT